MYVCTSRITVYERHSKQKSVSSGNFFEPVSCRRLRSWSFVHTMQLQEVNQGIALNRSYSSNTPLALVCICSDDSCWVVEESVGFAGMLVSAVSYCAC